MSTAIVILLLLGFSICVIVGLVTVLQNLINHDSLIDPTRCPSLLQDASSSGSEQ